MTVNANDFRREVRNVVRFCANECERQQTTAVAVANMLDAYEWVFFFYENLHPDKKFDKDFLLSIAVRLEPEKNAAGIRKTPVTFANGGHAASPQFIDRQLDMLIEHQMVLPVDNIVHRFLEIHPFADGNGRVAAILFNFLNGDLAAPQPLPEYTFT